MLCNFHLLGSVHDMALSWRRALQRFWRGVRTLNWKSRQCPQPTASKSVRLLVGQPQPGFSTKAGPWDFPPPGGS